MPNAVIAQTPRRWVEPGAGDEPAGAVSLCHLYKKWFDVVPADTPERLAEAYRLRYQVYCVENAFENAAEHPDGLERDQYDRHSVHSLLVHRASGAVAGTVRLILPVAGGIDALPISRVCDAAALRDCARLPPERTAEISRFAVSKSFRRRLTDRQHVDMHYLESSPRDLQERRVMAPNITLGLMQGLAQMAVENDVTHLCAVMEPSLLRLISRLGIRFEPLGPLVNYHGKRQPCYAQIDALGTSLANSRPEALELITDEGRYWKGVAAAPAE